MPFPEMLDSATQSQLTKALHRASEAGNVSAAETLLAAFAARNSKDVGAAAISALRAALAKQKWGVVAYLASFLADTETGFETYKITYDELSSYFGGADSFRLSDAIRPVVSQRDDQCIFGSAYTSGSSENFIGFGRVIPKTPRGDIGSPERPSPYFNLASLGRSLRTLQNRNDVVIKQGAIRVVFDFPYPLDTMPQTHTLSAPNGKQGFTRGKLAEAVARKYREIFASGDSGLPRW